MIPVVILGLGRVSAGNVGLAGDLPMSHLAAVRAVPGLAVAGLVDPDPARRAAVLRHHPDLPGEAVVSDLSQLPPGGGEVIAVCTPPETHAEALAAALGRDPRLVIVEKPLAADLETASGMVAAAAAAGTALRVNFNRRFDPRHRRWRGEAPKEPRAIVLTYGKGMFNYASHMIDLLLDWYGPVAEVQALCRDAPSANDPCLGFRCRMAAGFDAVVVGVDGLGYDQFETDILGPEERLAMLAGGAEMRRYLPVEDLHYHGYRHLAEDEAARDTGPVGGFRELYAAVAAHLDDGEPLAGCDGQAALANMAVLDAALRSAARGGIPVAPAVTLADAA